MFQQSYEKLNRKSFDTNVRHDMFVILTPQGLNRFIWPHIAIKQTFVMFVQPSEKLCRKTLDTNILNNLLFGLSKAKIDW